MVDQIIESVGPEKLLEKISERAQAHADDDTENAGYGVTLPKE